jgi:tRNA nucleotidyltransferase (CCA-adding enzyme)
MQTYLVGGAVRDTLLNRRVTERDYVVVGATVDEMLAKGYTQVGKDFPVFLHPKTADEYALARTERKSGKGYTGFICDASPTVTLEEDLKRRDLTVNAMAKGPDGTLIDPYGGQQDIDKKVLRHVSEAFSEDPLRVFRVARFATRYHYLQFTIAPETLTLMQQMAQSGELKALSPERVWQETKRSLLENSPAVFIKVLRDIQGLDDWFEELTTPPANLNYAIEALTHTHTDKDGNTQRNAKTSEHQLCLRFSALCSGLSTHQTRALCQRLRVPNYVSDVAQLVSEHKETLLSDAPFNADILLNLFNQADAWRRPERFEIVLAAMMPLARVNHLNWQLRHALIVQCLEAANNVNPQEIIARGVKGPEIRTALNKAKYENIAAVISNTTINTL